MTINGAIIQLVMMAEDSMMPNIFRPALDKVIETISELDPKPRWIPCSERLPEEDKQEYLVTAKALKRNCLDMASFTTDLYSVDKYDFYDRKGEPGWYFLDSELGFVELHDVIAWMPLPEPYKGVER